MRFAILVTAVVFAGCGASDGSTFTLYRNSVTDSEMRIHVATFDAGDGESYNRGNCEQTRELFQAQPRVQTRFWCEKGRFRR